jgi:hypothetical protein
MKMMITMLNIGDVAFDVIRWALALFVGFPIGLLLLYLIVRTVALAVYQSKWDVEHKEDEDE